MDQLFGAAVPPSPESDIEKDDEKDPKILEMKQEIEHQEYKGATAVTPAAN
jgi:hypothetical protein